MFLKLPVGYKGFKNEKPAGPAMMTGNSSVKPELETRI